MTNKNMENIATFKVAFTKALAGQEGYLPELQSEKSEIIKAVSLFKTPRRWIKQRKGKAGRNFEYVPGGLVKRALNLLFGLSWSFNFDVLELSKERALVKGFLRVSTPHGDVVRADVGGKINEKSRTTGEWIHSEVDLLKAAVTDSIKRCAAQFGLFLDLWIEDERRQSDTVPVGELTVREFAKNYVEMVIASGKVDVMQKAAELLQLLSQFDTGNAPVLLGYKKLLEEKINKINKK